ncbi:hypothetical protein DXT91_24650 [Agrobacterium tumefaciens]|uniref:hypothetical protein n=1 Tax=Agrobacterium tumefaciens TaxID=358 RepID=UPI003AF5EC24|nr:hypothetical protein [Agrobacterium tumefaciens]
MNLPVCIAGALVRPGNLVIADPNGVVFLDPVEFSEMYVHLIHFQDQEPTAREEIRAGVKLSDKFGAAAMVWRNAVYIHS